MNDFTLKYHLVSDNGSATIKYYSLFDNGDIPIGPCELQNQTLLLICPKGSFKQFPATCVGADDYIESEDPAEFLREVREQFIADGMTVSAIAFEDNKLKIDADY